MVKVIGVPTHVPMEGVTVMVPEIGVLPELVPLNAVMSPLPEAPNPIAGFEFVQSKVTPVAELVNAGIEIDPPLHCETSLTAFIDGVVPTVMVYVCAGPVHPAKEGVMVTVPVVELPLGLVAVNPGTLVFPDAPKPTLVLEFDQVTVDVAGTAVIAVAGAASPEQYVWLAGAVTVGDGFTVMVNVEAGPVHVPIEGVTEMVLVMAAEVLLVAVNAGRLVVPEAPNPIPGLLFVQLKLAPAGVLAKVFAGTLTPLQTVMLDSGVTVGTPPTVTVTFAVLLQVPVDPVTV